MIHCCWLLSPVTTMPIPNTFCAFLLSFFLLIQAQNRTSNPKGLRFRHAWATFTMEPLFIQLSFFLRSRRRWYLISHSQHILFCKINNFHMHSDNRTTIKNLILFKIKWNHIWNVVQKKNKTAATSQKLQMWIVLLLRVTADLTLTLFSLWFVCTLARSHSNSLLLILFYFLASFSDIWQFSVYCVDPQAFDTLR